MCVCVLHTIRVGQNRVYTPYMTVYLAISLPKIPYVQRIHMVLANPNHVGRDPTWVNAGADDGGHASSLGSFVIFLFRPVHMRGGIAKSVCKRKGSVDPSSAECLQMQGLCGSFFCRVLANARALWILPLQSVCECKGPVDPSSAECLQLQGLCRSFLCRVFTNARAL